MEKYSSGWRGSPAKGVDPFKRDARVQIPPSPPYAQIAQSVEQGTENPRVGGSIPPLGTKKISSLLKDLSRGLVQLVERRSPKPDVTGSSPVTPAILILYMDL